ncbi:MAG: hypothetical protein ACOY95_03290 [Pseudomonadota bacterium]
MKRLLIIAALLTGCAAFNQDAAWEKVWKDTQTMSPDQAISRLGIPSDERFVSGRKVLVWRDGRGGSYCEFSIMYEGTRASKANYDGQNGPCIDWLKFRGYM